MRISSKHAAAFIEYAKLYGRAIKEARSKRSRVISPSTIATLVQRDNKPAAWKKIIHWLLKTN